MLAHHLPGAALHPGVVSWQTQDSRGIAQDGLQVFGPQGHEGVGDLIGDVMAPLPAGEGAGCKMEERKEGTEHGPVDEAQQLGIGLHAVLHAYRHTFWLGLRVSISCHNRWRLWSRSG